MKDMYVVGWSYGETIYSRNGCGKPDDRELLPNGQGYLTISSPLTKKQAEFMRDRTKERVGGSPKIFKLVEVHPKKKRKKTGRGQ